MYSRKRASIERALQVKRSNFDQPGSRIWARCMDVVPFNSLLSVNCWKIDHDREMNNCGLCPTRILWHQVSHQIFTTSTFPTKLLPTVGGGHVGWQQSSVNAVCFQHVLWTCPMRTLYNRFYHIHLDAITGDDGCSLDDLWSLCFCWCDAILYIISGLDCILDLDCVTPPPSHSK